MILLVFAIECMLVVLGDRLYCGEWIWEAR